MKILFKLFVIISLVGLLSCKKEYVCECNGGIYNPRYVYHETKKKAKEKCAQKSS